MSHWKQKKVSKIKGLRSATNIIILLTYCNHDIMVFPFIILYQHKSVAHQTDQLLHKH